MPVDATPKVVAAHIAAVGAILATATPTANPPPAPAADFRAASRSFLANSCALDELGPMDLDLLEVGLEGLRRVRNAVDEPFDQLDQVRRTLTLSQNSDSLVAHRGERTVVLADGFLIGIQVVGTDLLDVVERGTLEVADPVEQHSPCRIGKLCRGPCCLPRSFFGITSHVDGTLRRGLRRLGHLVPGHVSEILQPPTATVPKLHCHSHPSLRGYRHPPTVGAGTATRAEPRSLHWIRER